MMSYVLIAAIIIGLIIIILLAKKLLSSKRPAVDKEIAKVAKAISEKEIPKEAKKEKVPFFKRIFGKKPEQSAVQAKPAQAAITSESDLTGKLTGKEVQQVNTLTEFIKKATTDGNDINKIKQALLQKGWKQKYVELAIQNATK